MTPEQITARLFRSKFMDEFKERIRARMHVRDGVVGYAIEIVRELHGEEYQYVGWVSMQMLATDDIWVADQWSMCDRAFAATIKEISH